MNYVLLIKCILSGFFLAAPIGPVNLICIKSTLTYGYITGLTVGIGAAPLYLLTVFILIIIEILGNIFIPLIMENNYTANRYMIF